MSELTEKEIEVLKEVAQDRMAVSRVAGKVKNVALFVGAVLAAYVLIVEQGVSWLRAKLGF